MAESSRYQTLMTRVDRGPAPNKFVYFVRKIYNPLGFNKGYNFPLWVITCGALFGFVLARFQYLDIDGIFLKDAIPGEQFWYRKGGSDRRAMIIHLSTVLPAGLLVIFQFIPVIRYKAIMFHRLNGYVCILLLAIGTASAFGLANHAVGGSPSTQVFIGVFGVMVLTALILAYVNIKLLQIDQHRAWMMRAWVWAASIISLRLILLASNKVATNYYTFWDAIPCDQIFFMYSFVAGIPDSKNPTALIYPQCKGIPSNVSAAVSTRPTGRGGPENAAALVHLTFGMSGWLALTIHALLLELYLWLTPAEAARLRMVSYEKQVKAGRRSPEKGWLTGTRLGDAPPGWNAPILDNELLGEHLSYKPALDARDSDNSQMTLGANNVVQIPRKPVGAGSDADVV